MSMRDVKLKEIGQKCKEFRKKIKASQRDVANDLCYTAENISAFENGRNDNAIILLWYVRNGLDFTQ